VWRGTPAGLGLDDVDVRLHAGHTSGRPRGVRVPTPTGLGQDLVVVIAIAAAVLVLVGIPLVAWWASGRQSWRRSRTAADAYVPLEMKRRHELQRSEVSMVERAATWGRELQDDRLRAAVVELAERQTGPGGGRRLLPLWLVVLYAAFGAVLVGFLVFSAVEGRWPWGNWLNLVVLGGYGVLGWRWQTGPERAVRLNSGPRSPSRHGRR
jgi:uncharacterized membrane protein YqjE